MSSGIKEVVYSIYRIRVSDYRILSADQNFEKLTGYSSNDYTERVLKHTDLIPKSDIVEYMGKIRAMADSEQEAFLEHRLIKKNKECIVVFCYSRFYQDQATKERMAEIMITDVTDTSVISKIKADDKSYMVVSEHDTLTGLYNRGAFEKRVNEDIKSSGNGICTMMLVDINNLKRINDTYGHRAGDIVINRIAAALVSVFKSDVLLSRTGGDEFCIYIPEWKDDSIQQRYLRNIQDVVSHMIFIEYPDIRLSVTVGTACLERRKAVFQILYNHADIALLQAKHSGKDHVEVFYNSFSDQRRFSDSLLVVSVNQNVRKSIYNTFGTKYNIIEAITSESAIQLIDSEKESIVLVLTDMYATGIAGFELLDYMRKMDYIINIPVVFISSEYIEDVYKNAFSHGVIDIVTEPFDTYSLSSRLNNIIDLYKHKNALEEKTIRQNKKIEKLNEKIIESLGNVVEFRDVESGRHIKRVKSFTKVLGECVMKECPEYELTQKKIDMIVQASPLHDVGKIAISDTILLKPGRLTPEEYEIMKTHTTKGYDIIIKIFGEGEEEYRAYCSDIARYHHEKYDGKGYPDGLVGDEIPISAQIVSLADVYDALVSKRCYKDSYSYDTAYQMIFHGECGVFNAKLLHCFTLVKESMQQQADKLKD